MIINLILSSDPNKDKYIFMIKITEYYSDLVLILQTIQIGLFMARLR